MLIFSFLQSLVRKMFFASLTEGIRSYLYTYLWICRRYSGKSRRDFS